VQQRAAAALSVHSRNRSQPCSGLDHNVYDKQ
jgi:hypothetical protein